MRSIDFDEMILKLIKIFSSKNLHIQYPRAKILCFITRRRERQMLRICEEYLSSDIFDSKATKDRKIHH